MTGSLILPVSCVVIKSKRKHVYLLLGLVFDCFCVGSINVEPSSDTRLAKVKVDSDFTAPCDTSILYPADGGNMHCFTAITACAVLDVLGPPYSDPAGRHCTYYFDHPFSSFSGTLLICSSFDLFCFAKSEKI